MACSGNLSWQYVNSMNLIVFVFDGTKGVNVWLGTFKIHWMSSLSLAWHWHFVCGQVHSMSHSGTVCFWLLLLVLHAFVNV
jgi:hypothetical protein